MTSSVYEGRFFRLGARHVKPVRYATTAAARAIDPVKSTKTDHATLVSPFGGTTTDRRSQPLR
jgi:hypothetical protein